jgi:hypothetical protein
MSEKVMLIVPAELVRKIDENRGDLSQAEFIDLLIDSRLSEETRGQRGVSKEEVESLKTAVNKFLAREEAAKHKFATKEEFLSFQQDTRKLLKSFLDFFIGYGLELGKQSPTNELAEITSKLKGLEDELASEEEGGDVKIKWK